MKKYRIAIDLDGTLATYDKFEGLDKIGEPRPGARQFLIDLKHVTRAHLIIHTCRCNAEYNPLPGEDPSTLALRIAKWVAKHEMPCDEIYTGQGKVVADAYLDDRGVSIPKNPTEPDFAEAMRQILALLH